MATFLELINKVHVRNDLDPVASVSDTSPKALTQTKQFINDVYFDIVNTSLDWNWREATGTINVVANTNTYTLPSTVDVDGLKSLKYSDTFQPINYLSYNQFDEELYPYHYDLFLNAAVQTTSRPNIYTIVGNQIILYPTPTTNSSIIYRYQQIPSELVNNNDTPIIPIKYQNVLVYGASAQLASFLGVNDMRMNTDTALFSEGLSKMVTHNRKFINSHPSMKLRPNRWIQ